MVLLWSNQFRATQGPLNTIQEGVSIIFDQTTSTVSINYLQKTPWSEATNGNVNISLERFYEYLEKAYEDKIDLNVKLNLSISQIEAFLQKCHNLVFDTNLTTAGQGFLSKKTPKHVEIYRKILDSHVPDAEKIFKIIAVNAKIEESKKNASPGSSLQNKCYTAINQLIKEALLPEATSKLDHKI